MTARGGVLVVLVLALAGLAAQAGRTQPAPRVTLPDSIDASVYLIGDAGAPAEREPVLEALQRGLEEAPDRSVAVFLGDNVYPDGLPPEEDQSRKEAERRLNAQIDAIKRSGARAVFVAGNHDWGGASGDDGWGAILRQGEYIAAHGGDRVTLQPEAGCPGPAILDFGTVLRLVFIDTQWWLSKSPPPRHARDDKPCAFVPQSRAADSLRTVLRAPGVRRTVLMSHHPLVSGGAHGGYFSTKTQVYPLTGVKSWLRVPLPMVGSVYVAARRAGFSEQDLMSRQYRSLVNQLMDSFSRTEPLVYAAGHEHNLQVMTSKDPPRYHLVSGSGIHGHVSAVQRLDPKGYAAARSGFMRLRTWVDGRVLLTVMTVDEAGQAKEEFNRWVVEKPTRKTPQVTHAR